MRRGAVAAAALFAGLTLVSVAAGGPVQPTPARFGVADDTGKYANDSGAAFFGQIASLGLRDDRMTVLWDPSHPATISDRTFLDRSIATAVSDGVQVRLAVRPTTPTAVGTSAVRAKAFGSFVALLAKRYPQVKTFVIGNEPNQPRFWQPQFSKGKAVAAIGYEKLLADSYDALKAVDPSLTVIGGVVSSRGNDSPT